MLGEEEERQTHYTIELHKRAQHDKKRSFRISLLLNQEEGKHDDGSYSDVKLLHIKGCQQFMGTEPQNEQLLVFRHVGTTDSHIQEQRQSHTP